MPQLFSGNTGDSGLSDPARIFTSVAGNNAFVSAGLNRDLGATYPPSLSVTGGLNIDNIYPLISRNKVYGNHAAGRVGLSTDTYEDFNIIPYPAINFGYSRPGEPFVAKRNWWAFNMNLASHDGGLTNVAQYQREFVLSIYEIPSQLPVSASSFMALGRHGTGENWENIAIEGNIFAGRALVEGDTELPGLASRRGFDLAAEASVGGERFNGDPFLPGVRETFRLTNGEFYPVSLSVGKWYGGVCANQSRCGFF